MSAIAVVGSWHLAHVTAVCLAGIGHDVSLYFDEPRHPDEPGLRELEAQEIEMGRLRHEGFECMTGHQRIVWIAEDVPLDESESPIADGLFKLAGHLRGVFSELDVVIVSSQVPLGTCRVLEHQLGAPVAYVPENLRLGTALHDFSHPDRLVIGASKAETHEMVKHLLRRFIGLCTLGEGGITVCSLATAEMIKHATNAFLATSISLANEIARLGAHFDVDNAAVTSALRADSRIGPKAYVRSGAGFAPGTLARDLKALQWIGKAGGVPTTLVDAVLAVNDAAPKPPVRAHDLHLSRKR